MSFIGDLVGGNAQQTADKQAATQSLTGYNYLENPAASGVQSQVAGGNAANTAEQQLLGLQPMSSQTQTGFNNYLNSTGYNFQMQQGQQAISGNAASKGILNSGATAKALTQYGQNLGSTYFNNYLSQLGAVNATGNQIAGATAQAGSTGGSNAANATMSGGNAQAGMYSNLFGGGSGGSSSGDLGGLASAAMMFI